MMRRCPVCTVELSRPQWSCDTCGWRAEVADGIPVLAPAAEAAGGGFDPAQFQVLFDLEAGNFWFRARNALIVWAMAKYFPHARSMLELGCGTGFVSHAIEENFPDVALVASELFSSGAALAKRRLRNAEVVQMDGRNIPFEGEFDVAGAFDVIEHLAEDETVLGQLHKSLRPGGGLLVTVPQHQWLWSNLDAFSHHQRRYVKSELVRKVRHAGFSVLRCTSFMTLLLPAMLVSRLRLRNAPVDDPSAEFRISRWANAALGLAMGIERAAIRAGLPLPLGGSLLMVAQRT